MTGWPRGRSRDGGLDEVPLPVGASGRLWICGKRVVGPDAEAALVRAAQASVIVSFNERAELAKDYPDYVAWLDRHLGDRALWYPVPDFHAPALDVAVEIVDTIVDRLATDVGVIMHCAGGIGRAPTMATLVLIALGMSADDAGEHIARHRPMGGPEAGSQRELVAAYAARVA